MIHPPLSWKKTLVALMDYSKKLKIKNDLNLESILLTYLCIALGRISSCLGHNLDVYEKRDFAS